MFHPDFQIAFFRVHVPTSRTLKYLLAGAEEACWAHNPKVPGSKPGRAILFAFVQQLAELEDYATQLIAHNIIHILILLLYIMHYSE